MMKVPSLPAVCLCSSCPASSWSLCCRGWSPAARSARRSSRLKPFRRFLPLPSDSDSDSESSFSSSDPLSPSDPLSSLPSDHHSTFQDRLERLGFKNPAHFCR